MLSFSRILVTRLFELPAGFCYWPVNPTKGVPGGQVEVDLPGVRREQGRAAVQGGGEGRDRSCKTPYYSVYNDGDNTKIYDLMGHPNGERLKSEANDQIIDRRAETAFQVFSPSCSQAFLILAF